MSMRCLHSSVLIAWFAPTKHPRLHSDSPKFLIHPPIRTTEAVLSNGGSGNEARLDPFLVVQRPVRALILLRLHPLGSLNNGIGKIDRHGVFLTCTISRKSSSWERRKMPDTKKKVHVEIVSWCVTAKSYPSSKAAIG